jgi:hypothetical protein
VGFNMFVMRFHDGDVAAMKDNAFREVWGPYVDRAEPEFDLWHVRATDGGEADIYACVKGETFDSLMISRFSSGDVLSLLFESSPRLTPLCCRRVVRPCLCRKTNAIICPRS